jgi:hypothetical protein
MSDCDSLDRQLISGNRLALGPRLDFGRAHDLGGPHDRGAVHHARPLQVGEEPVEIVAKPARLLGQFLMGPSARCRRRLRRRRLGNASARYRTSEEGRGRTPTETRTSRRFSRPSAALSPQVVSRPAARRRPLALSRAREWRATFRRASYSGSIYQGRSPARIRSQPLAPQGVECYPAPRWRRAGFHQTASTGPSRYHPLRKPDGKPGAAAPSVPVAA